MTREREEAVAKLIAVAVVVVSTVAHRREQPSPTSFHASLLKELEEKSGTSSPTGAPSGQYRTSQAEGSK